MQTDDIRKIIEFKGPRCQLRQFQEEAAELIIAINKYFRTGDLENLMEELGDNDNMLDQMKYIFKDHWYKAEDKKKKAREKILEEISKNEGSF